MSPKLFALCSLFIAVSAGGFPTSYTTYSTAPLLPAAHGADPLLGYSPAAVGSHSYSPVAAPAAISYAAPIAKIASYAAPAVAVHSAPAIGSTQQSVYRSIDGTVSQYSKAVDTAFSSVRKYDTRINNNVYTPAIAKTLAYAAPAAAVVANPIAPAVYAAHAPAIYSAHATPAIQAYATKALSYSPAATVAHVSFNGYGAHYGW